MLITGKNKTRSHGKSHNGNNHIRLSQYFYKKLLATLLLLFCSSLFADSNVFISPNNVIISRTSLLPESIQRETYATIDRTRQTIIDTINTNHLWYTDEKHIEESIVPIIGLIDMSHDQPYADIIENSLNSSFNYLNSLATKTWSSHYVKELSHYIYINQFFSTLKNSSIIAKPISPIIKERLRNITIKDYSIEDAFFIVLAQCICANTFQNENWNSIIHKKPQSTKDIAIIALARLFKAQNASSNSFPNDVKAYTRKLNEILKLNYDNLNAEPSSQLEISTYFFSSMLAFNTPIDIIYNDKTLFPIDWRNHTANNIITWQCYHPATNQGFWDAKDDKTKRSISFESLKETAFAIFTLNLISNNYE